MTVAQSLFITLPSSQYDLNSVEKDLKDLIIVGHISVFFFFFFFSYVHLSNQIHV